MQWRLAACVVVLLSSFTASRGRADELAQSDAITPRAIVQALNEHPLPGLYEAHFSADLQCTKDNLCFEQGPECVSLSTWVLLLRTATEETVVACVVGNKEHACAPISRNDVRRNDCGIRAAVLSHPQSYVAGLIDAATQFVSPIPVGGISEAKLTLASLVTEEPHAKLELRKGTERRYHLLFASRSESEQRWRSSGPLPEELENGELEASFGPLPIPSHGDHHNYLLVWHFEAGTNGQHGGAYEKDTGLVLEEAQGELALLSTVPLGEAGNSRERNTFDGRLLCPKYSLAGLELLAGCPVNPDPFFGGPVVFTERCRRTCSPQPKDDRAGVYLFQQGALRKARGTSVRPPHRGDLAITERPLSQDVLPYLEITNLKRDVLDLRGLTVVSLDKDVWGKSEESALELNGTCILDAGDTILVVDNDVSHLEAHCWLGANGGNHRSLDAVGPVELRMFHEVITRSTPNAPKNLPGDAAPPTSYQRDAKGRTCIAEASPGQPNRSCP